MKLDMDKYLAAMTPPCIVVNGVEYRGTRCLSFAEAARLQGGLGEPNREKILEVVTEACGLVGIPAEVVTALPEAAVFQVLVSFFESGTTPPEAA